jgi:hypothetical protein
MWIRPIIPYKIECADSLSRQSFMIAINKLNIKKTNEKSSSAYTTYTLAWVALLFSGLCTFPTIYLGLLVKIKRGVDKKIYKFLFLVPIICGFIVPMALIFSMIFTSGDA